MRSPHSQEEYERLKDCNLVLVYLHLDNRNSYKAWKYVIKEYNVTGEYVVHYNLPADQQSAIEHFLQVHGLADLQTHRPRRKGARRKCCPPTSMPSPDCWSN